MVFPGAYSRSKSYFLELHKEPLYGRRAIADGLVEDRFEGLMVVDNCRLASKKVLVKPFDSKDDRQSFFFYLSIILLVRQQCSGGTIGHHLLTYDSAPVEPQGRLDLHRASAGLADLGHRTLGMVKML